MKQKRKIVSMGGGEYQILKPKTNDNHPNYYNYGTKKSLKAIVSLIDREIFDLDISEFILEEIKDYKKESYERHKKYLLNKLRLENNLKN